MLAGRWAKIGAGEVWHRVTIWSAASFTIWAGTTTCSAAYQWKLVQARTMYRWRSNIFLWTEGELPPKLETMLSTFVRQVSKIGCFGVRLPARALSFRYFFNEPIAGVVVRPASLQQLSFWHICSISAVEKQAGKSEARPMVLVRKVAHPRT